MFRLRVTFLVLIVSAVVLTACQPAITPLPEEMPAKTEAPAATDAPAATELLQESNPAPTPAGHSAPAATAASRNESLPANIVELTHDNWNQEVYFSSPPVLLFFWDPSNQYAEAMIPTVSEIADEYTGRVKVLAMDYQLYSELNTDFDIQQWPTLLFLINGQEQGRFEIIAEKEEVSQMMDQAIDMNPPIPLIDAKIPDDMKQLTYDNWHDEVYQSPLPVLLYFWEPNNRYALYAIPFITDVAAEYAGRLNVMAINIDEYSEIDPIFGIEQIPTALVLNQGNEITRIEMPTTKEDITSMLELYLP